MSRGKGTGSRIEAKDSISNGEDGTRRLRDVSGRSDMSRGSFLPPTSVYCTSQSTRLTSSIQIQHIVLGLD
jgi:hypothetical protein